VTTQETKSANDLALERTDLATRRTLMAADRTLMAWVRTALSMISFGFTIYKVLEGFLESGASLPHASSPRNLGMFLIGLGTASMVLGTVEYWQTLKELRRFEHFSGWRPSFVIALIMSLTGSFLFVSVAARVL
jgi:putative membrane protein